MYSLDRFKKECLEFTMKLGAYPDELQWRVNEVETANTVAYMRFFMDVSTEVEVKGEIFKLELVVCYSPMYSLPELFFRLYSISTGKISDYDSTLSLIYELSFKDVESLKREFFIAAKPNPCKKGIYYYLHECNFSELLNQMNLSSETPILPLWLSIVLQIFGLSLSPFLFS